MQGVARMEIYLFLRRSYVILCCLSFASSINAAPVMEGPFNANREDAGIKSLPIYWDYTDGPSGPAHWSDLSPDWKLCNAGESQSPINIETAKLKYDLDLDVPAVHEYKDTEASVVNNGHSIQVLWPAGTLFVEGKNYTLTHFEFHTPSEHAIDGTSFPLEMQLVHKNDEGDYAIIVVLSNYGPTNWWVEEFWHQIPTLDNINEPIPVGTLSPDGFRVNFSKYYRYEGSITTPNCQEKVVWTILSTVYEISEEQIEHLLTLLPSQNNRPLQALGKRKVSFPQSALASKTVEQGYSSRTI